MSSLSTKEEMPGGEMIMVFVKEENERLEEEVCTLGDMKGVCQKPAHWSSHKYLMSFKGWNCPMGHHCSLQESQKGRVLTIGMALGWSGGSLFSACIFVFTYVLSTEFHMLLSDIFFPHDLKVQAITKVKPYYTFSEDAMQLPLEDSTSSFID